MIPTTLGYYDMPILLASKEDAIILAEEKEN